MDNEPAPMAYPLSLVDDPQAFVEWYREIDDFDEAQRRLTNAAREHMKRNGNRSILDVGEAMDRSTAILEEFSSGLDDL